MYRVKIINFDNLDGHWLTKHKVGDIIEFNDTRLKHLKKNVEVIEHYRNITVSKKRCKHCGNWVIKRGIQILDY